mmetsp:Transcript_116488/g.301891  ORF Transcript_116488/g.301891 Transcript_116488/m.301891 type:complete len:200 (+) Transcript_116488:218-817(+)
MHTDRTSGLEQQRSSGCAGWLAFHSLPVCRHSHLLDSWFVFMGLRLAPCGVHHRRPDHPRELHAAVQCGHPLGHGGIDAFSECHALLPQPWPGLRTPCPSFGHHLRRALRALPPHLEHLRSNLALAASCVGHAAVGARVAAVLLTRSYRRRLRSAILLVPGDRSDLLQGAHESLHASEPQSNAHHQVRRQWEQLRRAAA